MNELSAALARLRRAMPRNADAMLICDELERRIAAANVELRAPVNKVNKPAVNSADVNKAADAVEKRAAYMRDYMRDKRAKPAASIA